MGRARGAIVFGVALAVRVSIVLGMNASDPLFAHPRADSILYLERAARIAGGELMAGQVFEQGPLYPYLLAPFVRLFGPSPVLPVTLVQCVLDALTATVVGVVAARVACVPFAGLCAGLLYAVGREPAFYASRLLAVTPLLLLLMLMLLCVERRPFLAGICGGLAALLWPGALPIAAFVTFAQLRAPRRFLGAALGLGVAIAPATLHNFAYERRLVLISSHGGITFYQGNNPTAEGTYTPAGSGSDIRTQEEESRKFASRLAGRELSSGEASRYLAGAARSWLLHNPRAALLLLGRKLLLIYSGRETALMYSMTFERGRFAPTLGRLPVTFSLLGILAPGALLLLAVRQRRSSARHAIDGVGPSLMSSTSVAAAGTLFTLVVVFVTTRYKMPLHPIACVWIGAAAASVPSSAGLAQLLAAVVAIPGIGLAWYDAHHVPIHLQSFCDLADIRIEEGDLASALLEVGIAAHRRRDYPPAIERIAWLHAAAPRAPEEAMGACTADLDPAPGALAASAALYRARGNDALARRLGRLALASGGRDPVTRAFAAEAVAPR
ncbi:MAG: hypothetical protein U0166_08465 [Acidobacteriota bacterium]